MNEPLSSRGLTYDTVGLTLSEGWSKARAADRRTYEQSLQLGDGPDRWAFASAEVMSWGVKRRSGFTIDAETVSGGDRLWLWLSLRSLTMPGKGLWRMAFPLVLLAQHRYRRRYLRALAGAIGD